MLADTTDGDDMGGCRVAADPDAHTGHMGAGVALDMDVDADVRVDGITAIIIMDTDDRG